MFARSIEQVFKDDEKQMKLAIQNARWCVAGVWVFGLGYYMLVNSI